MSFTPQNRIARSDCQPQFRIGNSGSCIPAWPAAALDAPSDYSVDFSDQLAIGERVVACTFGPPASFVIGWVAIFGSLVTIYGQWIISGLQTVRVSARTDRGQVLNAVVQCSVRANIPLLPPVVLQEAPNALAYGSVFVPDASGLEPLIVG